MPLPADGPVTPGDLLTLEALGHFRRTSTLRGVGLVLQHHLLVFVPCWKLREVQALLLATGLGDRMERAASYAEVLVRATSGVTGAEARPRAGTDTR